MAILPAASKLVGEVEPPLQLSGSEAFMDWNIVLPIADADRDTILRELNERGRTKETVDALIARDFRDGRICEVRGVLLSRTECVLLSQLQSKS